MCALLFSRTFAQLLLHATNDLRPLQLEKSSTKLLRSSMFVYLGDDRPTCLSATLSASSGLDQRVDPTWSQTNTNVSARSGPYDWRHIYICYRTKHSIIHGFAELCFPCNEWLYCFEAWQDHCHGHLDDLETGPSHVLQGKPQLGTFTFVLVLQATMRMQQFLHSNKWPDHVHRHVGDKLEKGHKLPVYPDWQHSCGKPFELVLHLVLHLQVHHGVPYGKPVRLKR